MVLITCYITAVSQVLFAHEKQRALPYSVGRGVRGPGRPADAQSRGREHTLAMASPALARIFAIFIVIYRGDDITKNPGYTRDMAAHIPTLISETPTLYLARFLADPNVSWTRSRTPISLRGMSLHYVASRPLPSH